MFSSMCPSTSLEGTLLTREQVEEISNRISKIVSDKVSKQLENAISVIQPKESKTAKRQIVKKH